MGKFQVGILGGFQGKVGTVVGGRWKGIDYMRHVGRKSNKPPTQAQLEQQARFTVVTRFIARINRLVQVSFKDTPELTGGNVAFAYNYEKALTGVYPAFDLDYSKCLVSKGDLQNGTLPVAAPVAGGLIKFDWQDNTGDTLANADDKSVHVVYCAETNQAVVTMMGADRTAKTHSVNVANFTGRTVQTWISFVSADKEYATSIFTGSHVVI